MSGPAIFRGGSWPIEPGQSALERLREAATCEYPYWSGSQVQRSALVEGGGGCSVGNPLFWFIGALSCAVASTFFWVLAVRAGDKTLAWMTAVVVVVACVAALFLGRLL